MIDENGYLVNDGLYMLLEAACVISIVAAFGIAIYIMWSSLKY